MRIRGRCNSETCISRGRNNGTHINRFMHNALDLHRRPLFRSA
jgi:hypothetical protein